MSDKSPRPYIISYDIACPKRLARLHRHLKKHATPLQYSVFEATLTPAALNTLLREISECIHPKEDDVRAYPIQRGVPIATLGPAYLPAGVLRFGEGLALREPRNISNAATRPAQP